MVNEELMKRLATMEQALADMRTALESEEETYDEDMSDEDSASELEAARAEEEDDTMAMPRRKPMPPKPEESDTYEDY